MSFGMFLAGAASGAAQGYMMHKMANRKGGTANPDGTAPDATTPAAGTTPAPATTAGTTTTPDASGALTGTATSTTSVKPLTGTTVKNPAASDQMAFNDTFNQLTEQEGVVG